MVGTPAALTSEVKATGDGKIVHSSRAATVCMTMIAFRGSFLAETCEIQPEKGRTPSLATAQISRELATPATVVFCSQVSRRPCLVSFVLSLTKIRPRMQMTFMKTCPPRPKAMSYMLTKGCGAPNAYNTSRFGRQNKNKITRGNPISADATADHQMPLAAVKLASLVSSEICPEASKPTKMPAVMK